MICARAYGRFKLNTASVAPSPIRTVRTQPATNHRRREACSDIISILHPDDTQSGRADRGSTPCKTR